MAKLMETYLLLNPIKSGDCAVNESCALHKSHERD